MLMNIRRQGFTVVELLIVIVVIAILAAISVVAFNGIQARAYDSARQNDIKTIAKALEMYYTEHGEYPTITATGAGLGGGVANSHPAYTNTWNDLANSLKPYIDKLPIDPTNGDRNGKRWVYTYQPQTASGSNIRCANSGASPPNSSYLITYKQAGDQSHEYAGNNCLSGQQRDRPPFIVQYPPAASSFYLKVNQ